MGLGIALPFVISLAQYRQHDQCGSLLLPCNVEELTHYV